MFNVGLTDAQVILKWIKLNLTPSLSSLRQIRAEKPLFSSNPELDNLVSTSRLSLIASWFSALCARSATSQTDLLSGHRFYFKSKKNNMWIILVISINTFFFLKPCLIIILPYHLEGSSSSSSSSSLLLLLLLLLFLDDSSDPSPPIPSPGIREGNLTHACTITRYYSATQEDLNERLYFAGSWALW